MANTAKNAILRAKIEGILTDLMPKTTAGNVMVDDTTTLTAKLAEIMTKLATIPTSDNIDGAVSTAIDALKQELLGDAPVEAYNTFTELAQYISEHKDVSDALTAAIGDKADKSAVDAIKATVDGLGALASKSTVSESDLDTALKDKVNAAAEGNHSHANKTVLDGITAEKVSAWDGKGNIFYSKTEPANMTEHDLWMQIVE